MEKPEIIQELEKFLRTVSEEERRKIFYVLDYTLSCFIGERRIPQIVSLDLYGILNKLRQVEVIKTRTLTWRGNQYENLYFEEDIKPYITDLLKKKYYPLLTEEEISERIRKAVKENFPAATEFWHEVERFEGIQYTLSSYYEYKPELIKLGKKLSINEAGYYIGYYSTRWNYYDEFIFRKEPVDARKIFLQVVKEEVEKVLTSFTPEMRWCIYLKSLKPDADESFILRNSARYLPSEIRKALSMMPNIKIEKFKDIEERVLEKEKERLSNILRGLLIRDPSTILSLSVMFSLGKEGEKCFKIEKYVLDKAKDLFETYKYEEIFQLYARFFKDYGIILETNYGDLLLPKALKEVFEAELRGRMSELKIFESELDARSFIEDEMGKAISNIKIWDPYVTSKTLSIIERAVRSGNITIEILSSQPQTIGDIITLSKKGLKIKARMVFQKKGSRYVSPFHDRYLIIDNARVWHFGPSFHAAGEKEWESTTLFSENFGKLILQAFRFNFERPRESWENEGFQVLDKDFSKGGSI